MIDSRIVLTLVVITGLLLAGFLYLATAQFSQANSTDLVSLQSPVGLQNTSKPEATNDLSAANPFSNDCQVSTSFPDSVRQWCSLITNYALQRSLDPNLLAALIFQESGGNPDAYSHSGAVGLMQVMPRDGLASEFMCPNGPCFQSRPSTAELKDPEFNISYGTKMLAGLIRKYGDVREALKSYGPMDVGYYYSDKVLGIYQHYAN
jgi:hypothetical protein